LADYACGAIQRRVFRLGIEVPDRTSAGAVPHSTTVLTDGALNLGKSTLDVTVTGTATIVMFLKLSTFSQNIKAVQNLKRILNSFF